MSLQGFNKSRAYLIGVGDYAYPIKNLSTPVKDIVGIARCLSDFDTITKRAHLTKSRFEAFLNQLIDEVNNSGTDRVLFYFAGHGTSINNTKGPQGFLIFKNDTKDENSGNYKIEDLLINLNKLNCKHLLLVLDCCFAGAVQWDITKRSAGRKNQEKITDPLYKVFSGNNAWQIITSAAANQEAINSYNLPVKKIWSDGLRNEESDHSPFAIQFINALKGVGKEDFFAEQIITANRLYIYITENLIKDFEENEADHEQVPGLFTLRNHRNGQFIFSFKDEKFVPAIIPEIENPYKGFESYTEDDADIFFGRDELIATFRKDAETCRNFLVTGVSGIGKSSVVKAGFIPLVLKGINKAFVYRPSTFKDADCDKLLKTWEQNPATPYVLFFDQFEEFLDLLKDDKEDKKKSKDEQTKADKIREEKENKKDQIKKIIQNAAEYKNVYVFVAIRSDKKRQLAETQEIDWTMFREIVIPFPASTDIEDIIVKPALRHAWIIRATENEGAENKDIDIKKDEAFINTIVEAYKESGSLPFLSTALHQWYKMSSKADNHNRVLKQDTWGRFNFIEEVFKEKLQDIIENEKKLLPFQMLMFRLLRYNESNPARKKLELRYTSAQDNNLSEDAGLLKDLENERIIQNIQERDSIELAHDSIIEKWMVNQAWFKARNNKSNGNIAALIEAQNKLIPAAYNWNKANLEKGFRNQRKAKKLLWNHEEELPVLKNDLEKTPAKDIFWEHLKSTFGCPSPIAVADANYFKPTEIDFIQRSVKKSKIGEKLYYQIGLLIMAGLGIFLYYLSYQIKQTQKEANKNKAYLYAEKSLNQGETEALYLLRMADSLYNGADSFILDRINSLFYKRDFIGNPFAIATSQVKPELDKFLHDSVKDKLVFYNSNNDTLYWDYINNFKTDNYSDITKEHLQKNKIIKSYSQSEIDNILAKSKVLNYRISEKWDSLFVISSTEKTLDYNIYIAKDSLYKQKLSFDKQDKRIPLRFSPRKKYIIFKDLDLLRIYDLTLKMICELNIKNSLLENNGIFNDTEDKFFFSATKRLKKTPDTLFYFDIKIARKIVTKIITPNLKSNIISSSGNEVIIRETIKKSNKDILRFTKHNLNTGEKSVLGNCYHNKRGKKATIKFFNNSYFIYSPNDTTIKFSSSKSYYIAPAPIYEFTRDGNYIYSTTRNAGTNLSVTKIYSSNGSVDSVLSFSSTKTLSFIQSIKNNTRFIVGFTDNSFYVFNNNSRFDIHEPIMVFDMDSLILQNAALIINDTNILFKSNNKTYSFLPDNELAKFESFRTINIDTLTLIVTGSAIEKNKKNSTVYFMWNIKNGKRVYFKNSDSPAFIFSFSPDYNYFCMENWETNGIDFYNVETGDKVYHSVEFQNKGFTQPIFIENDSFRFCVFDTNNKPQIRFLPYKIIEIVRSKSYPKFPHLLNPK